jgi:hypothetical protein
MHSGHEGIDRNHKLPALGRREHGGIVGQAEAGLAGQRGEISFDQGELVQIQSFVPGQPAFSVASLPRWGEMRCSPIVTACFVLGFKIGYVFLSDGWPPGR